jgi:hypothetical protein
MRGMTDRAGDPQALTVLTTEHFVPQTARSGTIGEANGRASIYLGALSSALIAPGFTSDRPEAFQVGNPRGTKDPERDRGLRLPALLAPQRLRARAERGNRPGT